MTLVWLSPGFPADRAELASVLSGGQPADVADFAVADPATRVDELAVGSLCVVTVFETELLTQLAHRPSGVGLLVVGPQGYAAADGSSVVAASSIGELAAAIRHEATGIPFATAPLDAVGPAALADAPTVAKQPSAIRTRVIAAGAVLGGLAIGGIVIASTEGASAGQGNTAFGGRNFPGGGSGGFQGDAQGGGTFPGGQAPNAQGGSGTQGRTSTQTGPGAGAFPGGQQLLACLKQQGFTGTIDQLRQSATDQKLRQAFLTCMQQLQTGGGNTSSQSTGRP